MKICFLVFLSFLIFPFSAHADEETITTVEVGDPAPFTGTLLNPAAAARILAESETAELRCVARIDKETGLVNAERQREIDVLTARLDTCNFLSNSRLEILKNQNEFLLDEMKRYKKPNEVWWFAGGTVVGTAVTVALVFALSPAM